MKVLNKDINHRGTTSKLHIVLSYLYSITESISGRRIYDTRLRYRPVPKVLSIKKRYIYIVNPLSASRTILNVISGDKSDKSKEIIRGSVGDIEGSVGSIDKYTIFSICRNPWERIVSCYNKKILNANNIKKVAILAQYDGLRPRMDFASFVSWLCGPEGSDEHADPHWVSQTQILYDDDSTPIVDEIIRLEELESQFASLCDRLEIPFDGLPRRATSNDQLYPPPYEDLQGYYGNLSQSDILRLEKRYASDAALLGYPMLREVLG